MALPDSVGEGAATPNPSHWLVRLCMGVLFYSSVKCTGAPKHIDVKNVEIKIKKT